MNNDWTAGYVGEIGYTFGYYRELNPSIIQFCLLANGFLPPAVQGSFEYCELGYGQGISINLLAAANPRGNFWGTDFNPEQASFAREIADQSRNKAQLFDDGFSEFLHRDLPQFDFIVLHGVWSWVSQDVQQDILRFLGARLKVGGAVFISYNILPGWSQELPLRDLLMAHMSLASPAKTPITARISDAVQFANGLLTNRARFFDANPRMAAFLRDLANDDPKYLAHEYFNRSWDLIYFHDMAQKLEASKLSFACSGHQLDMLDVLNFRGTIGKFVNRINDGNLRETARDFALNRRFRRDIFTRGARRLSAGEQWSLLRDVSFMLQGNPADVPKESCGPDNEVSLDDHVIGAIVDVLYAAGDAVPLRRILENDLLRNVAPLRIIVSLKVLVGLRHVHPIFAPGQRIPETSTCEHFNAAMSSQACFHNNFKYLASPVLQGAINVDRFQLLFLRGIEMGLSSAEALASFGWDNAASGEKRIKLEGKILNSPEEGIAEFHRRAVDFLEVELPVLRRFGVS